jgi:hypothetical protein
MLTDVSEELAASIVRVITVLYKVKQYGVLGKCVFILYIIINISTLQLRLTEITMQLQHYINNVLQPD